MVSTNLQLPQYVGNVIVASVVKVFLVRAQLDFCMKADPTAK